MTTDEVQKYKFAAEQVGLTTQQMTTAFKLLANHMGAGSTLTGMSHAIKLFGQYGLSTRDAQGKMKGLPEMLGDVADRMSKFDNAAQRVRFANEMMGEMGFRLIPLLMNGSAAVKKLFEDFNTLNLAMREKFINTAFLTGQRVKMMKQAFQVFKSEIALGIMPTIIRLAGKLTWLASKATEVARKTTMTKSAWIAFGVYATAAVVRLAGGVRALLMLLGRFVWPIALAGILYLIFDDFFALLTGKKSIIGETLDELYGAGTAAKFAKDLKAAWEEVKKVVVELLPSMKDLGKILVDVIPMAVRGVSYVLKGLLETIEGIRGALDKLFWFSDTRANADAIYDRAIADGKTKAQAQAEKDQYIINARMKARTVDMGFKERDDMAMTAHRQFDASKYQPGKGALRGPSIHNGNNVVNVSVDGSQNPPGVVKEIKEKSGSIFEEMNQAASEAGLHGAM
jgi:hypothetical protein